MSSDVIDEAAADGQVTVAVYDEPSSFVSLAAEWDVLLDRAGSDLYSSPAWCEIWWKHYGRGRLCVLTFRAAGTLVGVLPMFVERVWALPLRVRVAKLIGSDSTIAVIKPAVLESHAEAVIAEAIERLWRSEGCDVVWFGPLSGHRSQEKVVKRAAGTTGALVIHERPMGPHSEFEPPATYDGYLQSLDKRQRQNLRRDLNQLAGKHVVKTDVITARAEVAEEFDRFLSLHARQWGEQNRLGHFGDWPGSVGFTRDLVSVLSQRDAVRLVRIQIDGEVAAYEFCLLCGKTCHWRLPARQAGAHWDKLGLGRVGMTRMIEAAIADGATRIEGGPGHYEYKVKHGATEYDVHSILIVRHGSGANLRAKLLLAWAWFLHFVYYRVWYIRLRPRTGLPGRPLWREWIRRRM